MNRGEPFDMWCERRECGLPDCHNAQLKVDSNGFSYCPVCKTVYNDGKPPHRPKSESQLIKASAVKAQKRRKEFKRLCKP